MTQERMFDQSSLFIDGAFVPSLSGGMLDSIDPSTEEVWARIPAGNAADVDVAVAAARAALHGPWARISATDRGALMFALARLIERDAEELAVLESTDNGKPLRDTLSEVRRAASWLTYYGGAADKIQGSVIPYRPGTLAFTRLEPVGVVAAIMPWNSPISLYSWKLGPALAAGNTVVLKPAEQASVSALRLAALIAEAKFPAGVVNIVTGLGEEAGAALARHPGVDKVTFTGESSTASRIMAAAAENLTRVSFECGGKSPHILFADADLDRAIPLVMHGAFRSTGQSCSLGSRLFLHEDIYERVLDRLAERTARIRVGRPLDPATHIGPQSTQQQYEKTNEYIALGRDSGARLVVGGSRPTEFDRGYFVSPTIFAEVDNRSRIAQEEIFGPVLSVIRFRDENEVIEMANDTNYGLNAGLWTRDIGRAHRVAEQIQSGLVSINTFRPVHWTLPYGGYKKSGIGRENGLDAIHEFVEIKTIVVDHAEEPVPDPFP
jgi:acyl-CoA reductase-like NAD-dependent aldehyde dehydrogenase